MVAGTGWYATRDAPLTRPVAKATTTGCPSPSPTPSPVALPLPAQVRVELLNGTSRNGLALAVGRELEGRGFVVPVKANAPAALPGPTRVVWGPGAEAEAALVASHIAGSMTISEPQAKAGSVQVTLGNAFLRLASTAEVAAAQPKSTPTALTCVSMRG